MYFPGDPLLAVDPIYQSIPEPFARNLRWLRFELSQTVPEWALGYSFDIILGGRA